MFQLLPVTKVVSVIAGVYALVVVMSFYLLNNVGIPMRPWMAFTSATVVDLLLMMFVYFAWRRLWKWFPILNTWLYPDLNGKWHATIDWVGAEDSGRSEGNVHIKQDFFKMSIDMDADKSSSKTIALCVQKDPLSGRPLLHYIYEVREKYNTPGKNKTYRGAASLEVDVESVDKLSGNYFTSRRTGGHFVFTRLN